VGILIKTYTPKPPTIRACKFTGLNHAEIAQLLKDGGQKNIVKLKYVVRYEEKYTGIRQVVVQGDYVVVEPYNAFRKSGWDIENYYMEVVE